MTSPKYVLRFGRIFSALEILANHREGLPLVQLAAELGATPREVREEILAYYCAESAVDPALGNEVPALVFENRFGEEAEPNEAEIIRLTDPGALRELGIYRHSTAEMAELWRVGRMVSQYEPDNADLTSALDAIGERWLSGTDSAPGEEGAEYIAVIRKAIEERRRLHIGYSRAWRPGVYERDVDPYRLVSTTRGYELDAGPLDEDGRPRVYLLSNVSDLLPLEEHFTRPEGLVDILDTNRRETEATVVVPQDGAWAADRIAERVTRVREDGDDVELLLSLAPPVAQRLALILVPSAGAGMVVEPKDLEAAPAELAQQLLQHHRLDLT